MSRRHDWFSSDLHFNHHNILNFDVPRPFASIEEHNETIIENWNKLIGPKDKVLLLGDIAFNTGLPCIERLNGIKDLVMGNHEHWNISKYVPLFRDIKSCWEYKGDKIVFTHIPVHPQLLTRWDFNVHGHMHQSRILKKARDGRSFCLVPDQRYINIAPEFTEYKPVSHETLRIYIEKYADFRRRIG